MPPCCGVALDDVDCCSSSSIGKNSDVSGESCFEEPEVQSQFKGPLDSMDALEEDLPIKRSLSKFYNGKSKSFASLEEASSFSSIKDFVKPEDPYTKKRKYISAHRDIWDTNDGYSPKKAANSSRRIFPVEPRASLSNNKRSTEESRFIASLPCRCRPPMHPRTCYKRPATKTSGSLSPLQSSPWLSLPLLDLHCTAITNK